VVAQLLYRYLARTSSSPAALPLLRGGATIHELRSTLFRETLVFFLVDQDLQMP
jgi:hypothetical protein